MGRRIQKGIVLVASAVLVSAVACAETTSEPDPCSNGPVYDRGFQKFEVASDTSPALRCTPHCGYDGGPNGGPGQGMVYVDALPSGACTSIDGPCGITIAPTCCGETTRGPSGIAHVMRCDCVDGTWKCVIVGQGGGACGRCAIGDASVEGG